MSRETRQQAKFDAAKAKHERQVKKNQERLKKEREKDAKRRERFDALGKKGVIQKRK